MNVLEQVVLAFQSLAHTLRQLLRPGLWAPWLPVAGLEIGVVLALWWFAHPALSWFAAPALQAAAGESALRYPNVFRLLPALYARADLLIVSLVGAVAVGASTVLFAARFTGRPLPARDGLGQGLRRAGALIAANLPLNLLLLGFSYGFDWWLEGRGSGGLLRRLAPVLTLAMAVVLQALFLWVNPLLMLGRRSLLGAFADLPRAAGRGLWTALTLAAAAAVPLLPIQFLARNTDAIVERGTPEMVGWLVVGQALIALLAAFALTGASTLAYQSLVGPALEDRA